MLGARIYMKFRENRDVAPPPPPPPSPPPTPATATQPPPKTTAPAFMSVRQRKPTAHQQRVIASFNHTAVFQQLQFLDAFLMCPAFVVRRGRFMAFAIGLLLRSFGLTFGIPRSIYRSMTAAPASITPPRTSHPQAFCMMCGFEFQSEDANYCMGPSGKEVIWSTEFSVRRCCALVTTLDRSGAECSKSTSQLKELPETSDGNSRRQAHPTVVLG